MAKIVLREDQLNTLKKHAESTWPSEACAILLGKVGEFEVRVDEMVLTKNTDESSVSFAVDPQSLLEIYERADNEGMEVAGIFHSHPALPFPSAVDAKFMRLNPVVWVIMSMPGGEYAAHQWLNGRINAVKIENC